MNWLRRLKNWLNRHFHQDLPDSTEVYATRMDDVIAPRASGGWVDNGKRYEREGHEMVVLHFEHGHNEVSVVPGSHPLTGEFFTPDTVFINMKSPQLGNYTVFESREDWTKRMIRKLQEDGLV
jgi:hypothetical protein